jgi:hypothetical protein
VQKKVESGLIACFVNDGIIYQKKDMFRILSDLLFIKYEQFDSNGLKKVGEGRVFRVYNNINNSSVLMNGRIYLNVNSFEYLQIHTDSSSNTSFFELFTPDFSLRIYPLEAEDKEAQWQMDAISDKDFFEGEQEDD